jgi:hypothetical protein
MPESDLSRAFGFDLVGREDPERVEIRRSSLGVSLIPGQSADSVQTLVAHRRFSTVIGRWLLVASARAIPQRTPESR